MFPRFCAAATKRKGGWRRGKARHKFIFDPSIETLRGAGISPPRLLILFTKCQRCGIVSPDRNLRNDADYLSSA